MKENFSLFISCIIRRVEKSGGKREKMPVTQKITILRVIFLLAVNLIHPWFGFSVYPRKTSPKMYV